MCVTCEHTNEFFGGQREEIDAILTDHPCVVVEFHNRLDLRQRQLIGPCRCRWSIRWFRWIVRGSHFVLTKEYISSNKQLVFLVIVIIVVRRLNQWHEEFD